MKNSLCALKSNTTPKLRIWRHMRVAVLHQTDPWLTVVWLLYIHNCFTVLLEDPVLHSFSFTLVGALLPVLQKREC